MVMMMMMMIIIIIIINMCLFRLWFDSIIASFEASMNSYMKHKTVCVRKVI